MEKPLDPMTPVVVQVKKKKRETADTSTLFLSVPESTSVAPFAPGQFNMLYAFGVGEIPISVSGDPHRSAPLVHTIRAVGAVSRALLALRRGDALGLRGPFGTAWPTEAVEGRDVVFVAGGLGLAPLRPAIYDLLRRRSSVGELTLLYGGRSPDEILFRSELEAWSQREDFKVEVTVDRKTEDWSGNVGVVTHLLDRCALDSDRTIAMVCGPEIMMRFVAANLVELGVSSEAIFLSMERNMKCAIGLCGHCQFGPEFICKDGAVFPFRALEHLLPIREL